MNPPCWASETAVSLNLKILWPAARRTCARKVSMACSTRVRFSLMLRCIARAVWGVFVHGCASCLRVRPAPIRLAGPAGLRRVGVPAWRRRRRLPVPGRSRGGGPSGSGRRGKPSSIGSGDRHQCSGTGLKPWRLARKVAPTRRTLGNGSTRSVAGRSRRPQLGLARARDQSRRTARVRRRREPLSACGGAYGSSGLPQNVSKAADERGRDLLWSLMLDLPSLDHTTPTDHLGAGQSTAMTARTR